MLDFYIVLFERLYQLYFIPQASSLPILSFFIVRRKRFSNSLLCQLVILWENWFNYNLRFLGIPRNLLSQETEDQKAGPYIPPREQRPGGGSTPTLRSFSTCHCALWPPRYSSGSSLGGEGWGPELSRKRGSSWVLLLLADPMGKLCPCSPLPTTSRRRKAGEGLLRRIRATVACGDAVLPA